MGHAMSRRGFFTAAAGAAVASRAAAAASGGRSRPTALAVGAERPAILGGPPVRGTPFPAWPVVDEREEKALSDVLHGGKWYRGDGKTVDRFEEAYARLTGARHCIATANGTSALYASLAALDVAPGDEVILPPYTFVATLNVVFLQYALPVFVDSDPETFQMDARRLEAAVTERTAVIIPVQRKQDAPLHRLEPVVEVGDGAVANDVRRVLQKILIHEMLERAFARRQQAAAVPGVRRLRLGFGWFHVAEKRQFLLSVRHGSTSTTRWFMMYCRRSGVLRPI